MFRTGRCLLLAVGAPGLLGSGCATTDVAMDGEWALIEAALPDGHWSEPGGGEYGLSVSEAGTSGYFGCNNAITAPNFTQDGDEVAFGHIAVGYARGCIPIVEDPLEGRYETALEAIDPRSGTAICWFCAAKGPS